MSDDVKDDKENSTATAASPGKSEVKAGESADKTSGNATSSQAQSSAKRDKHGVGEGTVHIKATWTNTHVTVTDRFGRVVASVSGGCVFTGSRKSTPHAAKVAAEKACQKAKMKGVSRVIVRVRGAGSGREPALSEVGQCFGKGGVTEIIDCTPIPHNGCRPPDERRV